MNNVLFCVPSSFFPCHAALFIFYRHRLYLNSLCRRRREPPPTPVALAVEIPSTGRRLSTRAAPPPHGTSPPFSLLPFVQLEPTLTKGPHCALVPNPPPANFSSVLALAIVPPSLSWRTTRVAGKRELKKETEGSSSPVVELKGPDLQQPTFPYFSIYSLIFQQQERLWNLRSLTRDEYLDYRIGPFLIGG
ncbi:uncharacterized protein LOC122050518 [Zingiber officinale]|uniref:uncharacterized protein LOC122050518 n=1 Tax=Zingiber officinale TaxID=94328 RepID=UPI001C4BB42D|nr:uncharacterized protein LOC122050518 [Zingiber officinale]